MMNRSIVGTLGLSVAIALWTSPARAASVVINEVLFHEVPSSVDPVRRHEWVELRNTDAVAADLTGWTLADRDGALGLAAQALPPVLLPPDGFLVVHYASGVDDLDLSDGRGDVYTGDPPGANLFDDNMDAVALYSPSGIVDFMEWNHGNSGFVPGIAHDDAVTAGQWRSGAFLNTKRFSHAPNEKVRKVRAGTSIGRDLTSDDTDDPNDWDATGGVAALDATPGKENHDLVFFVADTAQPEPKKKWTIIAYMDADNSLEGAMYHDVLELQRAGGSDANVNVVVMFDGLDMAQQATLDVNGDPVPVPGTLGKTWRFQVGPETVANQDYVRMLNQPGDNPFLGERNMGDPGQLSSFIAWAIQRYPAEKYGLFINDHGLGWKECCSDDTDDDELFMKELTAGLDGQFELIAFDACLMSMIEVAYQVQPVSKYFVGSEELISEDGYPYDEWLPELKANPDWSGAELGTEIVEKFHEFYSELDAEDDEEEDELHTLALIDQTMLPNLVSTVSTMAAELRNGVEDFVTHDTPEDNVEYRIEIAMRAAERFDEFEDDDEGEEDEDADADADDEDDEPVYADPDYMDLRHFAQLINNDPGIPACYKNAIATIVGAGWSEIVLAEAHGPGHPDANGLSIYFPLARTKPFEPTTDTTYDNPNSRDTDGASPRTMYAPNVDKIPLKARDVESGAPLAAPQKWPLLPSEDFRFPEDTLWDEFLQRYYHPVADNHITSATGPLGQVALPTLNDPVCGNPVDEITILPGWTVQFSGVGSSDADMEDPEDIHPKEWMWDFDDTANGCAMCIAPYEVGIDDDPAGANDDMNADHDANKAPLNDEKDATGQSVQRAYGAPGDYVVTLHVWDDNHIYEHHETIPDAQYVHIQTDDHLAIVHVTPLRHFQCYEVHAPIAPIPGVSLVDRFGMSTVDLIEARRLCNPADKNDEDPSAPFDPEHLTGYRLKQRTPKFARIRGLNAVNQFGSLSFDLLKPDYLYVPSAKSRTGTPLPLVDPSVDHFKCYRTSSAKFRATGIKVDDQFGTLLFDVKKPQRFCAPVDKNGEGVNDPGAYLTCYKVRLNALSPRVQAPGEIFVNNQFGPDQFFVTRATELCVPTLLNP